MPSLPTTNEVAQDRHAQEILSDLRDDNVIVLFQTRPFTGEPAPRHRSTAGPAPSGSPSRSADVAPRIRRRRSLRRHTEVVFAIAIWAVVLATFAACLYLRLTFDPGGQP